MRVLVAVLLWLVSAPAWAGYCADATPCTTNTTNASNLSTGTVPAARGGAGTISGALKGNGSGVVSQAACADLSNGATSCSTDTTNASNISSGTLPAARLPGYPLLFSSGGVATTAGTTAQFIGHAISTTESAVRLTSPYTGTLKSLYCTTSAAAGSGKTYTYASMVNGSAGTLTCTISGTSATTCNDTGHSDSVTAGQTVSVRSTGQASITTVQLSCSMQLQ